MKQYSCDVAIVAGGVSGLAAAITVAEAGLSAIVLEKSSVLGGTANMGMGPLGIGTIHQKRELSNITVEKAFKMFMDYTHWRSDARLVKKYFEKSGETIEWLEDMGVVFYKAAKYFPGAEATWHIVQPEQGVPGSRCAGVMMKRMVERAQELGVQMFVDTPAESIMMDNDRACGVIASSKDGEKIEVSSKAVIIATGGIGDNPEMMKEVSDIEYGKNYFGFRVPGLAGDGIRMAWAVGAGHTPINSEVNLRIVGEDDGNIRSTFFQPNLMVNKNGLRFFDEGTIENGTFAGNACKFQPDSFGLMVFDSRIKNIYIKKGIDFVRPVFHQDSVDDDAFMSIMERAKSEGHESLYMTDTLEELADLAGIDKEAFLQTVEEYNEMCESYDSLFYKSHEYMRKISKPPFFAAKLRPGGYGTLGGIKVNENMEVLRDDWSVIKGLYAAGTDTCTIYGDSYMFLLPGNTMGYALNSGRIAGESIDQFISENED